MNKKSPSLDFHDTIGKEGLSSLTTKKYDRAILHHVRSLLRKGQKILDAGCGYGRISIPLLKKGFDIYGIDLNKTYIRELKKQLSREEEKSRFTVADMCDLPFGAGTFDVVLCLWSVFDELLEKETQVKAAREMHRVLKEGGLGLIECHLYEEPTAEQIRDGDVTGEDGRVIRHAVAGGKYYQYNHDSETLKAVLAGAGIRDFSVGVEWFGWRERMVVRLYK